MNTEVDLKTKTFHQFTLTTGKVVLLKEPEMDMIENASKAMGAGSENSMASGISFQKELLKLLLYSIDGKVLSMTEKEALKMFFNFKESMQMLKAVSKVIGEDDEGKQVTHETVIHKI